MNMKLCVLAIGLHLITPCVFADQFNINLPQANSGAQGYGADVSGAVSDKLFYTLGGGSVISQPATRISMEKLGV
ncbi:integrating conjugative element protein, partial [Pectobacterium brasiliense]|nr:integrating conjugative element protein [Pectobacterium brasiliense]